MDEFIIRREAIVADIKPVPAADVVEVVRCKDCKHREGSCCDYSAVYIRENGYCHWGERKEGEDG